MVTMVTRLSLLVAMVMLAVGGTFACSLKLHDATRANMTASFSRSLLRGSTVVRFHLYLHTDTSESVSYVNGELTSSSIVPFRAKGPDTFAPYLWIWARKNGKYILRVPMDYHVLSFGILSLYTDDMDVLLISESPNCTEEIPYADVQNMVATLLNDEIVHVAENDDLSGDVIGRSAYTFSYYLGRVIGMKDCNKNPVTGNFTCNAQTYMKGWEMTWFGPLVVTVLFYIFVLLTIYKEYFAYKELRGNNPDIQKKISIIGQKILRDVERIQREIYGVSVEDNFIEYLQKVNFLDILGVSKIVQRKVIFVLQIIVAIVLLGAYYGIAGYSLYYHGLKNQRNFISLIENSHEVYVNVFGHLAWVYSNPSIRLKSYAIAEAVITCFIPVIMVFLYVMFTEKLRCQEVILPEKKEKAPRNVPNENFEAQVEVRYASFIQAFANSKFGIALSIILGLIVIIFWLCIGGLYVIYSLYMVGVGSFLTLNLFAGWLLPACMCIYYAYEVFTPLFELYTISKQMIFAETHKRGYLVKTDDYMLCPTSLIEQFYYGMSRGKVFEGFQRVFVALALLLMLFLIFIASQYPDFDITTKSSNLVMGVHIAIILPFLASMMQARAAMTDLEKEMLEQDIEKHVTAWETENEAMVEALKIRVQKLKRYEAEDGKAEDSPAVRPAASADAIPAVMPAVSTGNPKEETVQVLSPDETPTEKAESADFIEEGLEMNELTPFISNSEEGDDKAKK